MEISKEKYYQIVGLLTLCKSYTKKIDDITRTLAEIVNEPDDGGSYFGHVSDCIYEDDPVNYLLDRLDIEVKE